MKCIDCLNAEMCLDHKKHPSLIGCTSGIPERKKRTNADRIRSMNDEELAKFLINADCCIANAGKVDCSQSEECGICEKVIRNWLQSEAE